MSEVQNGPAGNGEVTPKMWAIVCTGFVGADSVPVTFADGDGKICPVIISVWPDQAKARRMLKRMKAKVARIEWFLSHKWQVTDPIYGVSEVDIPVKVSKPKKPKEAPATGKGETPPVPTVVPAPPKKNPK